MHIKFNRIGKLHMELVTQRGQIVMVDLPQLSCVVLAWWFRGQVWGMDLAMIGERQYGLN